MNEPRVGNSLVMHKGLICAIEGLPLRNLKCFYFTSNQCTFLASMKIDRRDTSAVKLNGELYVISGGTTTSFPAFDAFFLLFLKRRQNV